MALNLVTALTRIQKTSKINIIWRQIRLSHSFKNHAQLKRECTCQKTFHCRIFVPIQIQTRGIKVSDSRRALHPLIVIFWKPISRFFSIIFGIIIKKWWRKLSPEKKELILENIRKRKSSIAVVTLLGCFTFLLYYLNHIVETPITKRKRFLMIDETQMETISKITYEINMAELRSYVVPPGHPFYQRTLRVLRSLLRANIDIPEVSKPNWSVVVIDRPDILNAFCLANGKVFVFTGILNVCTNDDQLAIVLSHEMSHVILNHTAESLSKNFIVEAVLFFPSLISWIVFADFWPLMSEFLSKFLSNVLVQLPFSREIEREADLVGLCLAARSCFDVREAINFWHKMNFHLENQDLVEWLSTHPSSETRQDYIKSVLPTALEIRSKSNCPNLKSFLVSTFLQVFGP